jgi:hypothetical protein
MTKQTRGSKSKRNLAGNATGKQSQLNIHLLFFKLEVNPVANINEITQRLNAASPHTDAALTFQGSIAGDPETTHSGVDGEAEGKNDSQIEQVEVTASTDQPMTSVEIEQSASHAAPPTTT